MAPPPPSPVDHAAASAAAAISSRQARVDQEELEEIRRVARRYEDFTTIDWIQDSHRERALRAARQRAAQKRFSLSILPTLSSLLRRPSPDPHSSTSLRGHRRSRSAFKRAKDDPPHWWPHLNGWGYRFWLAWLAARGVGEEMTSWFVTAMVGALIGINMAVISIVTEWLSDLKMGYCRSSWWLNEKFCCWESYDSKLPDGAGSPPGGSVTPTTPGGAIVRAILSGSSMGATALLQGRAGESVDTCENWVPWSTWTVPSWFFYVVFAALFAFACAFLVRSFAPYAAGSGISEIKCILAGFIINGYLGPWTLAIKSLTLPLAIASGLSVGKEGPAVHVACCIGNVVARFFEKFKRSQAKMREILTAASAAGVAVAFGSPIGGVLFSLEEMAINFPSKTMWRSFLCALAGTVALSAMSPYRTGKLVLFQVSYDRGWHYFEIWFFIIIGIFGGLYGAFVIRYNIQVQAFRRKHLAAYGVSEAVVLATLTAAVGYFNKFIRIDMTESLEVLFRECEGGGDYDNLCQTSTQWRMVNSLLLATVLRAFFVVVSYGCKVPAGIFVPSMAVGATFGRMIGIIVKAIYRANPTSRFFASCDPDIPCITPGTYAFLGAAAALGGVTRITVAVVVIMFELTGALTYILPTMIVLMVTKAVGDWYGKGGISDKMIVFNGYPFLDKEEHEFGIPVSKVMKGQPNVLYASGMRLDEVEAKMRTTKFRGFPLVKDPTDWTLLGYLGRTEIRFAIDKAKQMRSLPPETQCIFTLTEVNELRDVGDSNGPRRMAGDEDEDDEDEESVAEDEQVLLENGLDEATSDLLDLGPWVDQTPLTVSPKMALEVVMDLFKKMGPRVVVVTNFGQLDGLITVKDCLRHIAAEERAAETRSLAERREQAEAGRVAAGELEEGLEELWEWAGRKMENVMERVRRWRGLPSRRAWTGWQAGGRRGDGGVLGFGSTRWSELSSGFGSGSGAGSPREGGSVSDALGVETVFENSARTSEERREELSQEEEHEQQFVLGADE